MFPSQMVVQGKKVVLINTLEKKDYNQAISCPPVELINVATNGLEK